MRGSSLGPQEDYNMENENCQVNTVVGVELTDKEEELLDEAFHFYYDDNYISSRPRPEDYGYPGQVISRERVEKWLDRRDD